MTVKINYSAHTKPSRSSSLLLWVISWKRKKSEIFSGAGVLTRNAMQPTCPDATERTVSEGFGLLPPESCWPALEVVKRSGGVKMKCLTSRYRCVRVCHCVCVRACVSPCVCVCYKKRMMRVTEGSSVIFTVHVGSHELVSDHVSYARQYTAHTHLCVCGHMCLCTHI